MRPEEYLRIKQIGDYLPIINEEDDFRVRFIDSNHTVVVSDGIYKKHTHILYEIMLVEHGPYRCILDGCELKLKPWDILLIQPRQQHEDFLFKGCSWFAFHFHLFSTKEHSLPSSVFLSDIRPQDQIAHISDHSFFLSLIQLLSSEGRKKEKRFDCYRLHNAIFAVILRKILSLYPKESLHEQFSQRISIDQEAARLYSVFSRHISEMPTLAELCRESNMSRSSLHRLCRNLFNMPPRKAFIHYKICHIQNFIRENRGFSVKELSQLFGFKTQFHFSRVFRNEAGCYPNFLIKQRNIVSVKK